MYVILEFGHVCLMLVKRKLISKITKYSNFNLHRNFNYGTIK